MRVFEEKREEEASPEQQSAASAYRPDEHAPTGPYVYGLVVLAAFAGATIRNRLHPRHRDLALASTREPHHPPHHDWSPRR